MVSSAARLEAVGTTPQRAARDAHFPAQADVISHPANPGGGDDHSAAVLKAVGVTPQRAVYGAPFTARFGGVHHPANPDATP